MAEAKSKPAASKETGAAAPAAEKKPRAPRSKAASTEPKATATKKPAAPRKTAASKPAAVTPGPQERYRMIEVAAYFIAERNGFIGDPKKFWAEAEAQINRLLAAS